MIELDDTEPTGEWKELLGNRQTLPRTDSAEKRAEEILRSGFVTRRYRLTLGEKIPWRALGFAASLLVFLAAAGGFGALATGRWDPVTTPEPTASVSTPTPAPTVQPTVDVGDAARYFAAVFPDTQQERAIRMALDNPEGEVYHWQLSEITELYFCGNVVTDSLSAVTFDDSGTCRVNNAPVIQGQVTDLRLLENMPYLTALMLNCQPLRDLAPIAGHTRLTELSLAGSPVSDLAALRDLPALETLHLEYTQVKDLTPLASLPGLKTVTVSRDMLPLIFDDTAPFEVVLAYK